MDVVNAEQVNDTVDPLNDIGWWGLVLKVAGAKYGRSVIDGVMTHHKLSL